MPNRPISARPLCGFLGRGRGEGQPEAHDVKAECIHCCGTPRIGGDIGGLEVLPTIELDHQPRLNAGEAAKWGPIGCCRLNLWPASRRSRKRYQRARSASVEARRSVRALTLASWCEREGQSLESSRWRARR